MDTTYFPIDEIPVPKPTSNELAGTVFVMTGQLLEYGERDYIEQLLVSLGAERKSGVSKKVNLLLVGYEPGKVKYNKALDLGIPIVGESWLGDLFLRNGFEKLGISMEAEFVD
jgi:NAD-dependent DNA ligase